MPVRGLWRAVAIHPQVPQLLASFGTHIFDGLGAASLTVWHFDLATHRVQLVASTLQPPPESPADLTHDEFTELYTWSRHGDAGRLPARKSGVHWRLVPPRRRAATRMLPLARDGCNGALVVEFPRPPSDSQVEAVQVLAEPLSVALANDRLVHTLTRDKDLVAADKQALLSRLGREEVADTIIGAHTGLREVVEGIRLVKDAEVSVLVLGETGSGKELVARAIHNQSSRAHGPLVRVNCGAIPPELVDSELFGHEAGSFTGASYTRKGWFERADGGTLFLDEVGELTPGAQVRLLRVLQEGTLQRVGGDELIHVDVRIIAATHRDLGAMVSERRFREDLWYRLNIFPIRLPSLRERREDIPALAAHFTQRIARRLGVMRIELTASDISLLVNYDWPGNVRELSAVVERAAILGNARKLEVAAALGVVTQTPIGPLVNVPPAEGSEQTEGLDAAVAQHIRKALEHCLGRIEGPFGAAAALRINPNTLRAKMRRLGIDWRVYRRGNLSNTSP